MMTRPIALELWGRSIVGCQQRARLQPQRLTTKRNIPSATVYRSSQRAQKLLHRTVTDLPISIYCNAAAESVTSVESEAVEYGSVVVIDNYDSFTYNLSQYLGELGCHHTVIFNDSKSVAEIKKMKPRGILISPGPGRPEDSGISMAVVEELGDELPMIGVCMGLQCMAQVFGGVIIRSPYGVMHGRASNVFHNSDGILKGLPNPFSAGRYHSLVVEKSSCPDELEVTAWTEDGTIMGIRHRELSHLQAVQFHPESILTDYGKQIIQNFIDSLEK